MAPPRRRVSYIIPPPSDPVPRLQLPPHGASRIGASGPLLIPIPHTTDTVEDIPPKWAQHPRHRLGVASLALDTSTSLMNNSTPEGILYSGGRDGLIVAWDLNIPMKPRTQRYGIPDSEFQRSVGRWEIMTGWADDILEEEGEESEDLRSDGDVLGDVQDVQNGRQKKRRKGIDSAIRYEEKWETDVDAFQSGKMSQFRQCVQAHTDWVNDLLLCNYDQTVVSASSDGTVKAWSPHATAPCEPTIVGTHADYVRCLSLCRDQHWVASGSFDRTIKLWDVSRDGHQPLTTLHSPESSGPKGSVYTLAVDPYGSVIASGSPERVVRLWDPRSGKRSGKLVGHTDNIRAILISEDAKYLLTGSADASIKLWSLATQRCLHTFTHHTDSVWSLFSTHPSLEIFYSGDRSGIVCKVDAEGCSDIAEGECVVICQDAETQSSGTSIEGVNKLVAMDDNLVWTATGSSSIKRWRVPARRAVRAAQLGSGPEDLGTAEQSPSDTILVPDFRYLSSQSPRSNSQRSLEPHSQSPSPPATSRGPRTSIALSVTDPAGTTLQADIEREGEETWYGLPFESLVKLTSPHDAFGGFSAMSRGRDPEIATLYSAASVMSVPRLVRAPLQSVSPFPAAGSGSGPPRSGSPIASETMHSRGPEETLHPLRTARIEYEEREVAADAVPLHAVPDEVIHGDHGLVRSAVLNDRLHALTVDTAGTVAVWDLVRGVCVGRFASEDIASASVCGSTRSSNSDGDKERSPREALETVRERIEGEAVVVSWMTVDTKTGLLTVHLNERCFEAEIYADEAGYSKDRHFGDEMRINVGKWALRNLFIYFIREILRGSPRRNRETSAAEASRLHRETAPTHISLDSSDHRSRSSSDSSRKSTSSPRSATVIMSPQMIPAVSPSIGPSLSRASPLTTPMISLTSAIRESSLSPIPQSPFSNESTPIPVPIPRRSATVDHGAPSSRDSDYFSLRGHRPSMSPSPSSPVPPSPDDFGSWGAPLVTPKPNDAQMPQTPSTPSAGGLMGRLRAFGKGGKRQNSDFPSTPGPHPIPDIITSPSDILHPQPPKTPLQVLLQGPLSPPSSNEVPSVPIPSHTSILISEECPSGWNTLYRGQVSSTGHDLRALEEAMPSWLLEYLIANKIPPIQTVKISFVLLPYPSKGPHEEQLPELLNTAQSKLTASRFLRVRKLTHHVQDKLEKMAASSRVHTAANTPRSSLDARSLSSVGRPREGDARHRPEDQYEILCHDTVLALDMTLAAVRQFVWRQSNELIMYYRRKTPIPPSPNIPSSGGQDTR